MSEHEIPLEITIDRLIAMQRKYKSIVIDVLTRYCEVHITKGEADAEG